MTIPGAVGVIGALTRHRTDILVGAGTVFDVETARRCLDAGAGFLTSPGLDLEIVDFALKRGVVVLPGALTPSEVMAAWKAGADFVKVFPCSQVGGPITSGLSKRRSANSVDRIGRRDPEERGRFHPRGRGRARIGQHLIHQNAIKRRQREWIFELARRYRNMVNEARGQLRI